MTPTKKQTLILWALLSQPNGAAQQNAIKPEVTATDREALRSVGLVSVAKGKRNSILLEVTEKGWGWAAEHLDDELPTNSPAGSQILQGWLKLVKAFLAVRGLGLGDFVMARPPIAEPQISAPVATLDRRIRQAYLEGAGGELNRRVFLAKLRNLLQDVPRDDLDDALRAMHLSGAAHLSGSDNPVELSAADRAAGVEFKGETIYAIWIER